MELFLYPQNQYRKYFIHIAYELLKQLMRISYTQNPSVKDTRICILVHPCFIYVSFIIVNVGKSIVKEHQVHVGVVVDIEGVLLASVNR